jgi:hypothetical protein
MAEILIKAEDTDVAESSKNWRRGDPIVVMPDGHTWGKSECLPKFAVLKLPGLSVEEVKDLIEPETDGVNDDGQPIVIRPRKWKIDLDNYPDTEKTDLRVIGRANSLLTRLKANVVRKADNQKVWQQ